MLCDGHVFARHEPVGVEAEDRLVVVVAGLVGEGPLAVAAMDQMAGLVVTGSAIPVAENETAIAYVKDAQWVEPPARLFARLMSDTIAAKTGRVVLSTAQSFADPGARLTGELRQFGVDAGTHQAVVVFDASLVRNDRHVFEKRRFMATTPMAKVDAANVGFALNQAANQVAGEVADWVGK